MPEEMSKAGACEGEGWRKGRLERRSMGHVVCDL